MLTQRTNRDWLESLSQIGSTRDLAVRDLRACELRAARFYLQHHSGDVSLIPPEEISMIAEDAAQEATLAVLARLENFRGDAAFVTWASKFGLMAAATLLRRRRWRDFSLEDVSE